MKNVPKYFFYKNREKILHECEEQRFEAYLRT